MPDKEDVLDRLLEQLRRDFFGPRVPVPRQIVAALAEAYEEGANGQTATPQVTPTPEQCPKCNSADRSGHIVMTHFAECIAFMLVWMALCALLRSIFDKDDGPRSYFD